MTAALKCALLTEMRRGDEPALKYLDAVNAAERRRLLRWLDECGLTLQLAARLDRAGLLKEERTKCHRELSGRLERSVVRTAALLTEFGRVIDCLQSGAITFAVLKGFSLAPDFCPDAHLRHQTDIDILVEPGDVVRGVAALDSLKYTPVSRERTGEVKLSTPMHCTPQASDDLYAPPRHSCVEFHVSLFESANEVILGVSDDWREATELRSVEGVVFPSLDLAHRMVVQLLHAFRHILHGWLRLGWLYEIGYAIDSHRNDPGLWSKVQNLLAGDRNARRGCGLVLELTRMLFGTELPMSAESWVAELSPAMRLWVNEYGMEWAIADFPGSRLSLLVHREFVDHPEGWRRFRAERLSLSLMAITPAKLLNLPFVYEEVRERWRYMRDFVRWRRLRAEVESGEKLH